MDDKVAMGSCYTHTHVWMVTLATEIQNYIE